MSACIEQRICGEDAHKTEARCTELKLAHKSKQAMTVSMVSRVSRHYRGGVSARIRSHQKRAHAVPLPQQAEGNASAYEGVRLAHKQHHMCVKKSNDQKHI